MKKVAIDKARDHIDLAKTAIDRLTLANGSKAYSQAWSDFLSQVSRFYSKLEQGAKGCNASEPWFGQIKAERKNDPVLAYLHHARNSDEHRLEYIVAETGSSVVGTLAEGATEVQVGFEVMVDDFGQVHVRNPQTDTPESFKSIELTEPRMEIAAVWDRGIKYDIPNMHFGRPIVFNSPQKIANLAIEYLDKTLAAAAELPEHS